MTDDCLFTFASVPGQNAASLYTPAAAARVSNGLAVTPLRVLTATGCHAFCSPNEDMDAAREAFLEYHATRIQLERQLEEAARKRQRDSDTPRYTSLRKDLVDPQKEARDVDGAGEYEFTI